MPSEHPARPSPPAGETPASASLPLDVQEVVLEFALATHKRAIYPDGHPMLHGAVDVLARRLQSLLASRKQLSLGIGDGCLVVDGIATDVENPLLRAFAERLHEHELGAVRFIHGIHRQELDEFLSIVATATVRGIEPLGSRGRDALGAWPSIEPIPSAFGKLALQEEGTARWGKSPSETLWLGLAQAAISGGEGEDVLHDPQRIAASIAERVASGNGTEVIAGFMRQLVESLQAGAQIDPSLRERVSELVRQIDAETMAVLLDAMGERGDRADFLDRATESLGATAIVHLMRAAASTSHRPIAGALLRLLGKLARAGGSRRAAGRTADRALRGVVRRMLTEWTLVDPNPDGYSTTLSTMAETPDIHHGDAARDLCEPARLLEIGILSGTLGRSVERAFQRLVREDGIGDTIDLLQALPDSPIREQLLERLTNETTLCEELAGATLDVRVLQHCVDRLDERAVPVLLDALDRRREEEAPLLMEMIGRIGAKAIPLLGNELSRLSSRALRHIAAAFDRHGEWPAGHDPWVYAHHHDAAVRREAMRFLLRGRATRDAAIAAAAGDADMRILNLAFGAAIEGCSLAAARAIMQRIDAAETSDELRARGIRAIGAVSHDEICDWLVSRVTTTHWFFRSQVRLRKPSLEFYAALSALAAHHADRPQGRAVLELARRDRNIARRLTDGVRHNSPSAVAAVS